jgi:hypothetical protein
MTTGTGISPGPATRAGSNRADLKLAGFKFAALFAALTAGIFGLAIVSAQAAEDTYTFKSDLSTPQAAWCITVPSSDLGTRPVIAACSGNANQVFGYENGGAVTSGGACLDGRSGTPGKRPGEGDPVVLVECDGSDHQAWQLPAFSGNPDVFSIGNNDGLCVTVDAPAIDEGAPLILAKCAEQPPQGWLRSKVAGGEEFYWYSGHRYCWYDGGWHGPGWYWCGENLHEGIGWGGPIGWHWWWHHHGHPWHPHQFPHPFPHLHPGPHGGPAPRVLIHPHVTPHPVFHPHATPHVAPRGGPPKHH